MIISYKDSCKLTGILIVSFCAVFISTLFLNYYMDLVTLEPVIPAGFSRNFYEAQCNTSIVVSAVSGGCMLLTTVVLLCFYVGYYIDTHKKQLGILKAMGYSRFAIAKGFGIFGLPVLIGTVSGFFCAHLLMPALYEVQNRDGYLPKFDVTFHPGLCVAVTVAPTIFFVILAMFYSCIRLKVPALALMRESLTVKVVRTGRDSDGTFLAELRKSNVRQRKSLVFFITFAVFCFSAMVQMSCSMDELASRMMSVMVMSVGIVLACVILLIATTSVIRSNSKTIIMMKIFGYEAKECAGTVFGGYRPWAYIGFIIGTVYQYALLKIMVSIVFAEVENMPEYEFDWPVMMAALVSFVVLYETVMHIYIKKIEKLSAKEIMLE